MCKISVKVNLVIQELGENTDDEVNSDTNICAESASNARNLTSGSYERPKREIVLPKKFDNFVMTK